MADRRTQARVTFDTAAALYQEARPEYPDGLFSELIRLTGIKPGDRLLEIGCATGKATIPLARRGLRITCLEIGASLAGLASQNLAAFPGVEVIEADFEAWQPPGQARFDLVFAATSWHWLDPATRYQQAWQLLAPGGHLAFWAALHVFPPAGDPIFLQLQDVYDEIGSGDGERQSWPAPGELPDERDQILRTGLFDQVSVRHFDWEVTYTAAQYIRLLETFSGHIAMADWQRERLYGEITSRLAGRGDGRLRRHWGAALHVARRRDAPG